MATLEEFMQSMSNRPTPASRSREFDHKAAPQSNAVSDGLVQWMQGVKERTLHPLEAIAKYSQDFQNMTPVDQGMQLVGGGMAGTLGKVGQGVAKQPIWKSLDDISSPAGTQWSPRNNYIDNPNYKTPVGSQDAGLPTKEQYEHILWKQKIEAKHAKADYAKDAQRAVNVDARRAAERGNIQPSGNIQSGISGEEWLAKRLAEIDAARGWVR